MQHNFYTTLKPVIIVLSCMGIVPYCFKNNKLCTSYLQSLYVTLVLVLYIALFCEATIGNYRDLRRTSFTSQTIQMIICNTQVILTFLNTLTRKKKFSKLSKTMFECENGFKEIIDSPHKIIKKHIYLHAVLYIGIMAPNLITQLFYLERAFLNKMSKYFIDFAFPMVLNNCIGISAVAHILQIRQGFKVLNECLERMQVSNKWEKFEYEFKQKSWTPNIENLTTISELHLKLMKCIREFNHVFEVILVATYVTSLINIFTTVYFFYSTYLESHYGLMSICVMLSLSYATNFFVLCQKCSSTIKEVKYIPILQAKIIGENKYKT